MVVTRSWGRSDGRGGRPIQGQWRKKKRTPAATNFCWLTNSSSHYLHLLGQQNCLPISLPPIDAHLSPSPSLDTATGRPMPLPPNFLHRIWSEQEGRCVAPHRHGPHWRCPHRIRHSPSTEAPLLRAPARGSLPRRREARRRRPALACSSRCCTSPARRAPPGIAPPLPVVALPGGTATYPDGAEALPGGVAACAGASPPTSTSNHGENKNERMTYGTHVSFSAKINLGSVFLCSTARVGIKI